MYTFHINSVLPLFDLHKIQDVAFMQHPVFVLYAGTHSTIKLERKKIRFLNGGFNH